MDQKTIWNDLNRFSQTGYSAPTIFPKPENYKDINLYNIDMKQAERREQSHQEWLEDERWEARMNGER